MVTHPQGLTEKMMQEHQDYIGMLMKQGKVLFSSLKSDMRAPVTVVKSETEQLIQEFYKEDPFLKNGVITYSISKLDKHYHVAEAESWFQTYEFEYMQFN